MLAFIPAMAKVMFPDIVSQIGGEPLAHQVTSVQLKMNEVKRVKNAKARRLKTAIEPISAS